MAILRLVLDSTVLVDVLRLVPAALAYVEALDERPACSELSRVEVLRGVRSDERQRAERLFGGVGWVPLNEAIARRAGQLGRDYRRSHGTISAGDLIVAATAQELGADLATSNVRHFPMFKGLRPPYRD